MIHEHTALVLRERRHLEALDSGIVIFRRFAAYLYRSFIIIYLPLAIAGAFVPKRFIWIPWIALWWIRPLWERMILTCLSRRFFGSGNRGPAAFRGLGGDLSWRRFSPWKLYTAPVRGLEGIKGIKLKKRIRTIIAEGLPWASAATIFMLFLEISLVAGIVAFFASFQSFIPHIFRMELSFNLPWVLPAIYIVHSIIAGFLIPVTTSMGFALYINRRVVLEGWDLEIAFRQMIQKRRTKTPGIGSIILILVSLTIALPAELSADTPDPVPLESLEQVLDQKDFGGSESKKELHWKETRARNKVFKKNNFNLNFSEKISFFLRILIITSLIILVVIIVVRNFKPFSPKKQRLRNIHSSEDREMAPDIPLPDIQTALRVYTEGREREACSILYQNAISLLEDWTDHDKQNDKTEGDWLNLIHASEAPSSLAGIIELWCRIAYAHQPLMKPNFDHAAKVLQTLQEQQTA